VLHGFPDLIHEINFHPHPDIHKKIMKINIYVAFERNRIGHWNKPLFCETELCTYKYIQEGKGILNFDRYLFVTYFLK
jgi:hypothetical protein